MFCGLPIGLPRARGSRSGLFPAIAIAALLLAAAAPSHSTTWLVRPDGAGDVPTIQAAIDAAANGDTILLDTGTFIGTGNKDLDTHGKAITIASLTGAESTIIDCQGSGRGFFIHSGEDSNTVLTGLHIANGSLSGGNGAGVLCLNSSPKLVENIFSLCYADTGAGAYFQGSSSKLIRNTFDRGNYTDASHYPFVGVAAGVFCRSSDLWIIDNLFTGNRALSCPCVMSLNSTIRFYSNRMINNGVMMDGPHVFAIGSHVFAIGNDVSNVYCVDGSTVYLQESTAIVRANRFGPAGTCCGEPGAVYAPDYGAPGSVDVSFNYISDVGHFYAVGIQSGRIHRNVFVSCDGAIVVWGPALPEITKNTFYQNGPGCFVDHWDVHGCPAVMSKNLHVGLSSWDVSKAMSCISGGCPMGGGTYDPLFISGYSGIVPGTIWWCAGPKLARTNDPQFCSPADGNFFLRATSPCLVENDPTLGATHGALPEGCGVDDVLDVAVPPDHSVRQYDLGDVIPLSGFEITNTSSMETVVNYALTCEGPVRLSDQGNPFALKGTTPILQPGQSYTPPEAAMVVTSDDEFFDVTITYATAYAPALLVPGTQSTTILFRRTVPVLLRGFEGAYEDDAVRLWWSVTEADGIEGWRVYRTAEGKDTPVLLTATALPGNSREYRDDGIADAGRYFYDLVVLIDGKEQVAGTTAVTTVAPGFVLGQNTPNPFTTTTTIEYAIPERASVSLSIYDAAGRRVRALVDAIQDPRTGGYSVSWDGKNDRGEAVASGVYVYRLKAGKAIVSKKLMLLR